MKTIDSIIKELAEKLYPELSLGSWVVTQKKDIIRQALTDYKKETLKLITEEIFQAHIDGDKTSRLTSLFNKIQTK